MMTYGLKSVTMRANDWHDPQWRESAHSWIGETLSSLGTPVLGEIEEARVRPWSVTHRATTAEGVRWFKANTMDCAYEARLVQVLAAWAPDSVLTPLAVDENRGWLLTADAGPTLRAAHGPDQLRDWREMLQAYAVLQRAVTPSVPRLLNVGVPDMRPETLPAVLDALLAAPEVPGDVTVDSAAFVQWCAELAADGVPPSVQHDDLHDDNVFPGFRFFDWGDASVSHPFGSLLVALNSASFVMDLEPADLENLRDAYLEIWTDLAPLSALRRSVTLACRVGRVPKAAAWQRALRDAALPVDEDFRTAVPEYLSEISEPTPV
jgi:hypothetical protein